MDSGHVFLSYSTADRALAEDLWRRLDSRGVRVWIAPHHIPPGSDYSEAIENAIESSSAVVALISDGANASRHVKAEIEIGFSRGKPLFPVRFQEIQPAKGLSLFLSLGHWTDLFGAGEAASLERLVAELLGRSGVTGARPVPIRPPAGPQPQRRPGVSTRFLVVTIALSLIVLASVVAFAILRRPAATQAAGARPQRLGTPSPDARKAPAPAAGAAAAPSPRIGQAPAANAPPQPPTGAGASLWEHNGSLLRLRAEGRRRVFVYLRPRADVPARAGDVLFDGERNGSTYRGTAFLFSSQCGRIGYAVAGSVAPDDRSVALRGAAPVRDRRSCALVGHSGDQLVFRFVEPQ